MNDNLQKFKKDLKMLIENGGMLRAAMQHDCFPDDLELQLKGAFKDDIKVAEFIKKLPEFGLGYQAWYSEALALLKVILPDRVNDFIRYFEKPKGRKSLESGNYCIEDYIQGLEISNMYGETKVSRSSGITQFEQQLNIIKAVERRFESSLFDIKQIAQADLFDAELDSAKELLKNKFIRASGAICGVVLEKHLAQVCGNHELKIGKQNPTISDFNDLLKKENIIDLPQFRHIQLLGDLRNLCDHNKKVEPIADQVNDLIVGVDKVIKTIF